MDGLFSMSFQFLTHINFIPSQVFTLYSFIVVIFPKDSEAP
ncbi:hypothetical protein GARC_0283 [Paraglaciecola arctica BSs20135]|uniref:Uncharacterized protein n=1 Tax=Paraglaciecola arctica BSs20135 TaxID=493475 RepID=K6Z1C1_9ALTE|nr:hypothetical protein GARC_0283 [Paraglaciecola arctica BSs20135]